MPRAELADELAHSREAIHLALRVVRLGESVAVQDHDVARTERRLLLVVMHAGQSSERHSCRSKLDDLIAASHERKIVARVRIRQPAGRRFQDRVEAGDEHILRNVGVEKVIHALEELARRPETRRFAPQDRPRRRHHQRGGHAMPGDVADDEPDLAAGQVDEVVEVAADLGCGAVERRDLPARQVRERLREELLLDELRDAELLRDPLARSDLCLLLADELRDAYRRRGLRGQLLQQATVIGRVVLIRKAPTKVE